MSFTKRELIEFFDRLTELVSEENRKEAEFQIQVFMDSFEKSYPYETTAHMGKDMPYHPSVHVASMPEPIQRELKEEVTARLKETGNYSPKNVECAMNSKLCDLEEILDIEKYVKKLRQEQKKMQERNQGGRR